MLVAYDGSLASQRAVQAAVDFAREGAQVIGVTVRAPTDDTDAEAPSTTLVETIAAHTGAFGVRLSTELPAPGIPPRRSWLQPVPTRPT